METKIETIRHSLSHIMALAIQEIFPNVRFGIGPAIENGFYYDFDLAEKISSNDLDRIEKKMNVLIKKEIKFKKRIVSKQEGNKIFKNQPYKLELIKEIPAKNITIYETGDFIDLCKGPHVKSSREISPIAFKLTKIAGAYWKGNAKNPMFTRIYGVAFQTKKELEKYLRLQEEAEKRDHRVLGKKLEMFLIDEEVGAGLPIWLPKGTVLRKIIENYLYKELSEQGYKWLSTPHIGNINLWKKSGHWNFYRENIYSPIKIEDEEFLLKPMNCPFHIKAYQSKIRSHKDLPIKFAELGTVYRYEKSGVLHGLTRVRGFTQDDAHIFCAPEQMANELTSILKYGLRILKTFGFKDYKIYLSTRPEKFMGTSKMWQQATNALKYAFSKLNLKYEIDPGGGVFYGPKIDIKIKDSLEREWQCSTFQIDFNLPKAFNVSYIDKNGRKKEPIMIHRALLGSLERFIGVLLEHYAGDLPVWLAPLQVWVIPISKSHKKYAEEINTKLLENQIRAEIKNENETVSKKIREGETQKIPYLLIIGDKEIKTKTVSIRKRKQGNLGETEIDKFIQKIKKEISDKG
jgi:threonyl-tRNA synthetase